MNINTHRDLQRLDTALRLILIDSAQILSIKNKLIPKFQIKIGSYVETVTCFSSEAGRYAFWCKNFRTADILLDSGRLRYDNTTHESRYLEELLLFRVINHLNYNKDMLEWFVNFWGVE